MKNHPDPKKKKTRGFLASPRCGYYDDDESEESSDNSAAEAEDVDEIDERKEAKLVKSIVNMDEDGFDERPSPRDSTGEFVRSSVCPESAMDFEEYEDEEQYPDEDGFEMSFEEAEALTRNINLLNFVRRNILKSNPKFLASTFGVLQETLTKYLQSGLSLPANWVSSVHDRGLLLAVDDNGLGYIGKLSDNYVYGFDSSCLNRYLQLRGRTSKQIPLRL